MKLKFLSCIFCITLFASFSFRDVEPEMVLPSNLKKEYLETSDSKDLQQVLTHNFTDFFDHIHKVDVHLNSNEGFYYYAVYGTKDKEATVQLFKVSEEYALNQTFPLLEKTTQNTRRSYCYYTPESYCVPYLPYPNALICAVNRRGTCIPY